MDEVVAGRHAGGGAVSTGIARQPATAERLDSGGPLWMLVVPPVAALAVMIWGLTGPSYTPDESATMSAVHRSFPELVRMLGNIDAVHGLYYTLLWVVVRIAGTGELATRLPSAVAMAVAAAATVGIGRRLISARAGLAAGLILAALPEVSFYAEDARPYAVMTAFATLASYALVRVLDADPERRTRWLVAYAGLMSLTGLAQVFALLLIGGHAVTVALRCRPGSDEPGKRSLALGWLAAVVVAVVVSSPVLWLGYKQRKSFNTVGFQRWPTRVEELFGSWQVVIALSAVLACGVAVDVIARRTRGTRGSRARSVSASHWPSNLVELSVPWLVVPPLVLLIASYITPIYTVRYVIYCLPAAALLCGAALDALGWAAGAVALAVIVLAGWPVQTAQRQVTGHGRNLREVDRVIAAHYQPGDAVLYGGLPTQYQQFAYPYGMAQLRDLQIAQTPAQSGTLTGTMVSGTVVRDRLRDVQRVWLVGGGPSVVKVSVGIVTKAGFRLVHFWPIPSDQVRLYARSRS
jgi:mannosyltransferase